MLPQVTRISGLELEQARNKKKLPSFFSIGGLASDSLPEELVNEPYAFEDNSLRPEIIVPRLRFSFAIEHLGVRFKIGSQEVSIRTSVKLMPIKFITNVSVVTVYDTYGLEVAYAYLNHLYYHKYDAEAPKWLEYYLLASLAVLQPDVIYDQDFNRDVLYLSSLLMLNLSRLDANEPKMLGQLVQTESDLLMPELVAKIVRSQRISKAISSLSRVLECDKVPTYQEMIGYEMEPRVFSPREGVYMLLYSSEASNHLWTLRQEDAHFIISLESEDDDDFWTDDVLAHDYENGEAMNSPSLTSHGASGLCVVAIFSVLDYVRAFARKGCAEPSKLVKKMLDQIISSDSVDEVCSWVLQLAYDSNDGRQIVLHSVNELRQELHRLTSSMKSKLD